MSERERELFEKNMHLLPNTCDTWMGLQMHPYFPERYRSTGLQCSWNGWQARAALEAKPVVRQVSDADVRNAWIVFDGQWFSDRAGEDSMSRMRRLLESIAPPQASVPVDSTKDQTVSISHIVGRMRKQAALDHKSGSESASSRVFAWADLLESIQTFQTMWDIAEHVRRCLDEKSCPSHWMDIAVEAASSFVPSRASVLVDDLEELVYKLENTYSPDGEYYAGVMQGFSYAADALRCIIAAHDKGNRND